MDVPAQVRIN